MAPRLDPTMEKNTKVFRRSASSNMERGGSFSETVQQETVATPEKLMMPQTISLPLLNFIDMFGVSLVVPLLFQYYKSAGVTSANQRELLSSVFSSSQILGGVILGAMTDAKIIKRKTVLYLSFGGSAIAYAMIAYGGFSALIVSRVLVGLVKQTMTVTTSLMTKCTSEENRAKHMGRLQSSTTAAWIFGPSVGGLLFKYVGHKAPLFLAASLFVVNMVLAAVLLPNNDPNNSDSDPDPKDLKKKAGKGSFWANLKTCFSSKSLAAVIASTLIFSWVTRATSYANMGSYYEDMYGIEPHHRGYIQSYQGILGFIVQSAFVGPVLSFIGGERRAICFSCVFMALATFWEMQQSIFIFLIALAPVISVSTAMVKVSLRSLLTTVAPEESIFSVFAALDVLQNVAAVSVPFYRASLFQILGGSSKDNHTAMEGDPDPVSWVFSSGIHWAIAAGAMVYFLSPSANHLSVERQRRSAVAKSV